jgi:4-coumarate--CoA ligase
MQSRGNFSWSECSEFPRFLADLLAAELARLRPGAIIPARPWNDELSFEADGLGVDSLEYLRVATAVAETLQFSHERPTGLLQTKRFGEWVLECRRLLDEAGEGIAFKTSGATGAPRFVSHAWETLSQETDHLANLFKGSKRIVSLTPCHHIYGFLFTILLPKRLGCPVLDFRAHALSSMGALLVPGDLIVAFPTIWQLMAQSDLRWPENVDGVTSGAPCSSEIAAALRFNGLRRLVEIYGSTETGGIGWRDHEDVAFRLFPDWSRVDADRIRKREDPEDRAFELPDIVLWRDEDSLTPLRRRDGAVQVGGVNVYPQLVRSALLAHPGVAEAQVRLMRPDEGDRLKAFIVPRDHSATAEQLRRQLETWIKQRLTAAERPRSLMFGTAAPVNEMGKPADWTIDFQEKTRAHE